MAGALANGAPAAVTLDDGTTVTLEPDDVDLIQEVSEGWGVASDGGTTVALELEVTPELRAEGLARELVRLIQDARRAAGLAVTDRIALAVQADGPVLHALEANRDYVAGETLATELHTGPAPDDAFRQQAMIDGRPVTVGIRSAPG